MTTAFVPGPLDGVSTDDAMPAALHWLYRQDGPHAVLMPTMRNIESSRLLKQVVPPEQITTLRSQSRHSIHRASAVLGCWPAPDGLGELHDLARQNKSVCIIRWSDTLEEQAWINSTNATNLLTDEVGDHRNPISVDPVVQAAMRSLSNSVNLSGWHPYDENRVKFVLRHAPREGHPYDPDHLFEWVLVEQLFPWDQATRIREMGAQVCEGRTLRLKYGVPYKPDIWDQWRADAAQS